MVRRARGPCNIEVMNRSVVPSILLALVAACGHGTKGAGGADGGAGAGGGSGGADSGGAGVGDAGPDAPVTPATDGGGDTTLARGRASAGCGKPLSLGKGIWIAQPTGCAQGTNNQGTAACQAIPPGSTVPTPATQGSPERRGWWVNVPAGYDGTKPYKVVFSTADNDGDFFSAGKFPDPYLTYADAIQVILDADTFAFTPGGYDDLDPRSNDLAFMPWLMNEIESSLCVDTGSEWMVARGSALPQLLDCAMPARLRGQVLVNGVEPGAVGAGGGLPECHPAPLAALYIQNASDTTRPYGSLVAGCSRVLRQNGCAATDCAAGATTPYPVPPKVSLPLGGIDCRQFDGCPAEAPVVLCTTHLTGRSTSSDRPIANALLGAFIDGLSPVVRCPTGEAPDGGVCACPDGKTACSTCADLMSDQKNCGACGVLCAAGATCAAGRCACPAGQSICGGECVDERSDASNCGGCGVACPTAVACVSGRCACAAPPSGGAAPASCASGGAGVNDCGACGEDCCASLSVPGGTFGRTYKSDSTGQLVTVSATVSAFRLDKYPVTVGRFRPFVGAWKAGWRPAVGAGKHAHLRGGQGLVDTTPGAAGGHEDGWLESYVSNVDLSDASLQQCSLGGFISNLPTYFTWTATPGEQERYPIDCVTWEEAYAFCIWDSGFLPSEAEWELAAEGGDELRPYPWGSTPPGNGIQLEIYGRHYGNELLAPVGLATAGAGRWGQLDLAGEVAQWTLDWYDGPYDPSVDGASLTVAFYRTQGGGAYPASSRTTGPYANAALGGPTGRDVLTGIRCARAP